MRFQVSSGTSNIFNAGSLNCILLPRRKPLPSFKQVRKDDTEHYGLIESVRIQTDAENGDYLTVSGHFLMILLSRRIIYPTMVIKEQTSYGEIIHTAIRKNCLQQNERFLPGLQLGEITGDCWKQETHLQISYANLMDL